jgi:hypothetical protein
MLALVPVASEPRHGASEARTEEVRSCTRRPGGWCGRAARPTVAGARSLPRCRHGRAREASFLSARSTMVQELLPWRGTPPYVGG